MIFTNVLIWLQKQYCPAYVWLTLHPNLTKLVDSMYWTLKIILFLNKTTFTQLLWIKDLIAPIKTDVIHQDCLLPMKLYLVLNASIFTRGTLI